MPLFLIGLKNLYKYHNLILKIYLPMFFLTVSFLESKRGKDTPMVMEIRMNNMVKPLKNMASINTTLSGFPFSIKVKFIIDNMVS